MQKSYAYQVKKKESAHQQVPCRIPVAYHEPGPNIRKIQYIVIAKTIVNDSYVAWCSKENNIRDVKN